MQSLALLNQTILENKISPPFINVITPGGIITGQLVTVQFLLEHIQPFQKQHTQWNNALQTGELARRRLQDYLDQFPSGSPAPQDTILLYHPNLITSSGHQSLGTYTHIDLRTINGWSYMDIGQKRHPLLEFLVRLSRYELYMALIILLLLMLIGIFMDLFGALVEFKFMPFG